MATKEQIYAVAEQLTQEGKNPTLAAVRERLGGGSYTDISAAMQQWRAGNKTEVKTLSEKAPEQMTERLTALGSDLWNLALEIAGKRLAVEREALEQARQESERVRQEAMDLADQLSAELEIAQQQIQAKNDVINQLEQQLYDAQQVINDNQQENQAANHRAELAEAKQQELTQRVVSVEAARIDTMQQLTHLTDMLINEQEFTKQAIAEMQTQFALLNATFGQAETKPKKRLPAKSVVIPNS